MTASKSNVDIFGSYLSRVAVADQGPPPDGSSDAGPETMILRLLALPTEPVSIKDLMANLKLPPSTIMNTLKVLGEAKLVDLTSTAVDECVAITEARAPHNVIAARRGIGWGIICS